ncbi:MAG: guanylate kinase [Eubacteriaceae bacterium]|nr:guanylate kinase [Eubacteriaceae bacterium]
MARGNFFVVSGPAGVGKSSIINKILAMDGNCRFSISATTRDPRPGETDGVNYHFLTNEQFEEKIAAGEFYEYARLFNQSYGTLKSEVEKFLETGIDVILDVDTQGALNIKAQNSEAILVFIMPPSFEELVRRIEGRHTETREQIEMRLKEASAEMEKSKHYDMIVVNDNLEDAIKEVYGIITSKRE